MDEDKKPTVNTPPKPTALSVQSSEEIKNRKSDVAKKEAAPKYATRRLGYRPSHRATFIGIVIVLAVIVVNVTVLAFVISNQQTQEELANANAVTLSSETLNTLGVNRTPTGETDEELVVGPDARFRAGVSVAEDLNVSKDITLNGSLIGREVRATELQAGDVSVNQLTVNGDGVLSNLTLRDGLAIAGTLQVQGQVTLGGNVAVTGNLSVGGTIAINDLRINSITVVTDATFGGHIKTAGSAPGVSTGGAAGSNATTSISGNDVSGTVVVNVGAGGSTGLLASVSFKRSYDATPHVVVTPIGRAAPNVYVNRNSGGFTISAGTPLAPGGYAFDYVVMQ